MKGRRRRRPTNVSQVQSPKSKLLVHFLEVFILLFILFIILFFILGWGWIWCFGLSVCFLVAVFIPLLQFASSFPSFHPAFAVRIAVSPVFIPLCSLPGFQSIASQSTRSLHPSYHPGLQCIPSQLNPSRMQLHCTASQFRSLHPSLYRTTSVYIPVCIPVCLYRSIAVYIPVCIPVCLYRSIAVCIPVCF